MPFTPARVHNYNDLASNIILYISVFIIQLLKVTFL